MEARVRSPERPFAVVQDCAESGPTQAVGHDIDRPRALRHKNQIREERI